MSYDDFSERVVTDPDAPALPVGCITSVALIALARAILRLENEHIRCNGSPRDLPCLRRLESSSGAIRAHVASGPPVGGNWFVLEYDQKLSDWKMK